MIILNFKLNYLRLSNDHVLLSSELFEFCFYIAKTSCNRQSSWQNTMRPQNIFALSLYLRLVNLPTSRKNSSFLLFVIRLMVSRQCHYLFSSINRQNCTTVANISYIAHVANNQNWNCTWSRSFKLFKTFLNKRIFCTPKSPFYSFSRIIKEILIFYDLSYLINNHSATYKCKLSLK